MTKDEQTKAIEKAGKKIVKGKVKNPLDKEGTDQEIAKIKEDIKSETKTEEKKVETKTKEKIKEKKIEVVAKAYNIPISTKEAVAVCKFINRKIIGRAILDLESVVKIKKAVPMKGEIPHRKGNIMSGRYPQKAAKNFIVLLKSLLGNANLNEIEEPLIFEAYANIGVRPFGRFGRYRRKRTNLVIKAVEKNKLKEVIKN